MGRVSCNNYFCHWFIQQWIIREPVYSEYNLKNNTDESDDIRSICDAPILVPVFSIFICVSDNIIKYGMHKCISPSLNWRDYGTIGALKSNSIYSVGFCSTTCIPAGKSQFNCEVVSTP